MGIPDLYRIHKWGLAQAEQLARVTQPMVTDEGRGEEGTASGL